MKVILPVLAAGLLLWCDTAGAQGYSGVMSPQQGYHAPAGASAPQDSAPSPYSGTGASDNTGHATVTATDGVEEAHAEPAMTPSDPDAAPPPTSAFTRSFAPKRSDDDDSGGASIYDTVNSNAGTATERRRQSILRKVEAQQRKAQRELERGNEERNRQVTEMVRKTVEDARRKAHGDDDEGADDQYLDEADQVDQAGEAAQTEQDAPDQPAPGGTSTQ